jgi:hypothetical protein
MILFWNNEPSVVGSQCQSLFTALHNDAFVSTRTLTNFVEKPDSEYVRR